MMKLYKNEAGFTLVEIMIVVLIIGVIAALAIPNLLSAQQTSWGKTCEANRSTIMAAVELYRIQSGSAPSTVDDLTSGVTVGGFTYDPTLPSAPTCPADKTTKYGLTVGQDGSITVTCANQGTGKKHP